MSGQKSQECQNFEDEPVKVSPGMIPDTYSFKFDSCAANSDKKKTEVAVEEKPKITPMPKTDVSKCAPPEKKVKAVTVEPCEDKPKPMEDTPPPACTNVPETKSFKCGEEYNKAAENNNTCCESGGGSGVNLQKNCKCGSPVPPMPKFGGCKNKSGYTGSCGPNTACEVYPLTMKKK